MSIETIFEGLLDEGVEVWRPVLAKRLSDGRYEVLGEVPDGERWEFPPASVVGVRRQILGGEIKLVAVGAD